MKRVTRDSWMEGKMEYKLASSTWDKEEYDSISNVIESTQLTMGKKVAEFERAFAHFVNARYAIMVNSGSSANLLAVASLLYKKNKPIRPDQEIIVPAVSWGTTYYPVSQYGLTLHFVDIDPNTLCMDVAKVKEAINKNTAAIFAVNLLGQPAELDKLRAIASEAKIYLIEDNCESMGATLEGKQCGTWGILGTFSTFFSHHISTMEGGLVVTDDEELRDILVSLRAHGWTRELSETNHVYNKIGNDWEDKFRFVLPGYNLRPLEIEGAIGIAQLKKLPLILEERIRNLEFFNDVFGQFASIRLQSGPGQSSSFGFSLVLEGKYQGKRRELQQAFDASGIESRPIVSGNFARQPVIQKLKTVMPKSLPVADDIHENGLFLGNHHFNLEKEIKYAAEVFVEWSKEN